MPSPEPRPLGGTGLTVTPIGLGLAALGRPAYINLSRDLGDRTVAGLEARTHEVLDAAYAAGIRYFDTARSYGRAEEFLASWVERAQPGDVTIGSKWGYRYVGDWRIEADVHELKEHSLETLDVQLAESRRWLRSNLDMYQIHSATLESGVLENSAVLRRLAGLHRNGLVIGLSVSGPGQAVTIRRALTIEIDGEPVFQCVQATWNVLEPSAGSALREAKDAGWGVIVKEALANGRLVDGPGELAAVADRLEAGTDAVALAAVLAQPWADVVLSGATSASQLASNLAASSLTLSAEDMRRLEGMAQPPARYWSVRSELPWH